MTDIMIDGGNGIIGFKVNLPVDYVLKAIKSGAEIERRINEEFADTEDEDSLTHFDLLMIAQEYYKLYNKIERAEREDEKHV